jgi:23S rRNA (cytosine1962-C5)-methyltransferase
MLSDKLQMFQNRLTKVYKHRGKQAKRMGISCYRLYDKDLPEFPVSIDVYDTRVCVSEYKAKHNLSEEEHLDWLEGTVDVIADVLQMDEELIYTEEKAAGRPNTRKLQKKKSFLKCRKMD